MNESARNAIRDRSKCHSMTANAFAEDKARCLMAGMNDFLIKPFTPRQVVLDLAAGAESKCQCLSIERPQIERKRTSPMPYTLGS